MPNRTKALLIAALAALALTVNVSSASAVVAKFASEKYPATLTGTQTAPHTLETVAGKLECKSATFSGILVAKSTTLTVTPAYATCTFVGAAATVAMNGCTYKFELGAMKGENESTGGGLEIICPAGKEIVVTAGLCVMKIPASLESAGFVNTVNLAGGEFELKVNIVVTYTLNNGCGKPEGKYELGKLLGNYKVKGNNGPVGVTE